MQNTHNYVGRFYEVCTCYPTITFYNMSVITASVAVYILLSCLNIPIESVLIPLDHICNAN